MIGLAILKQLAKNKIFLVSFLPIKNLKDIEILIMRFLYLSMIS